MATLQLLKRNVPLSASPVTTIQFANALSKIWKPPISYQDEKQTPTIGLAISGGVDSMALALLCSRLETGLLQDESELQNGDSRTWDSIIPHLRFRAFVVDHGVRSGSHDEASAVAEILEKRGIPTDVLKMKWPESPNSGTPSNFESIARKLRFQLLGKACSNHGINSLLLAHHEDDQAETIMMRLALGHRDRGLLGIKRQSAIPECYGIYGVHESGGREIKEVEDIPSDAPSCSTPHISQSEGYRPWPETGGISICRPLLGFAKANLMSTCQMAEMPWFEDTTNRDPTITSRNAVRHLFTNHALPVASSKARLLQLVHHMEEKVECRSETMRTWLAHCEIIDFDTFAGTVTVDIPDLAFLQSLTEPSGMNGQVAAESLREIVRLVSPDEHIDLSSLHGAVNRIFHAKLGPSFPSEAVVGFTGCGIHFQPRSMAQRSLHGGSMASCTTRWFLSRQPSPRNSQPPALIFPPTAGVWSQWRLFDGRFWIRLQNSSAMPVVIRFLTASDETHLRRTLRSHPHGRELSKVLRSRAPGNVRRSLPVVAYGESESRAMYPVAFGSHPAAQTLKWQVRYKKVYTDNLHLRPAWTSNDQK